MRHALIVALLAALATPVRAQEFASAAPASERSGAALLERGLPPPQPDLSITVLAIRWYGLPELDTRSATLALGWRTLRLGAGLSRSGDGELGWSAAAVAAGIADARGGAALRVCGRERRAMDDGAPLTGAEAGAGMWIAPSPALRVWVSAPQVWIQGDPPPLERGLEIGGAVRTGDAELWLARAAAPGAVGGSNADHMAGARLPLGVVDAWLELRDHPTRGGFGLAAAKRDLRLAATVESHPVLGDTVRLSLGWERR
jgi:hypothetical protein